MSLSDTDGHAGGAAAGEVGEVGGALRPYDHPRVAAAVREILAGIGEDPDRDGLKDTPERVARGGGAPPAPPPPPGGGRPRAGPAPRGAARPPTGTA